MFGCFYCDIEILGIAEQVVKEDDSMLGVIIISDLATQNIVSSVQHKQIIEEC